MSRSLQYRRHQYKRHVRRAYHIVKWWFPEWFFDPNRRSIFLLAIEREDVWKMAYKLADNLKACDGQCCKNPRRTKRHEITIQEKKALEDYYLQLEDL